MGAHGEKLIPQGARILTHCNAGALATGGYGTALGVIRAAVEAGKKVAVFADVAASGKGHLGKLVGGIVGRFSGAFDKSR